MIIKENVSLLSYNTFGIDVSARYFAEINSVSDLEFVTSSPEYKGEKMILGGGSNILFTKDYKGLIIKNSLFGINAEEHEDGSVLVTAAAGENWHKFVLHCIEQGWGGLENLSLIPGQVGASPMQNIGAYGVEIKDVFESLEAWNVKEKKLERFNREDCEFGYRESVFKRKLKDQYIICSVTYRLNKNATINTSYGAISDTLQAKGIDKPSYKDVSEVVIEIRSSKLPDPKEIGNAGSFFKNPIIARSKYDEAQKINNNLPHYPVNDEQVKVPAGWLIDQAGWKGFTRNKTHGIHKNQALVIVNYGGASGEEIVALAMEVQKDVFEKFGIQLTPEVNFV